jgi:lactose/L-arabinose transport system substrate-binding protein
MKRPDRNGNGVPSRRNIIGGLLPLLALWTVSCTPSPHATPDVETAGFDAAPGTEAHGDITVWSWNIAAKSLQQLSPVFSQRYPAIHAHVDMTGARMQTRLMLSLASGVGAPDVSQFELTDAPRYIATGKLADLTPVAAKYRSMFPASLWDNCTLNGRVYAIPWDMGPCAVYYKRDMFRRYGVDPDAIKTWDDYIEAGKRIVAASGGRTKMLPLGSNSLRPFFEMLIQQTGGQVFDDKGAIAINSRQNRQALDIIKRMRQAGICSDVQLWTQEFYAGLNDESIATYPIAVWFAGTMKDTVKDFAGKKAEWGVFRLPAAVPGGPRVANLGGSVLVIPDQCRNKAAAWKFVEYALCTQEGQLQQYKAFDLFPAFLPALQTPVIDEPDPFFMGQPIGRLFATDVAAIPRLNRTPFWSEAANYLDQGLSHWAATGMTDDNLLADIEHKLHLRLDKPVSPLSLAASEGNRP